VSDEDDSASVSGMGVVADRFLPGFSHAFIFEVDNAAIRI